VQNARKSTLAVIGVNFDSVKKKANSIPFGKEGHKLSQCEVVNFFKSSIL
jgi:hypothetical protein